MSEKNTIGRIAYLIDQLYEKGYFSAKDFKEHIRSNTKSELTRSTMKRTIADLREHLGLNIVFCPGEKIYKLDDDKGIISNTESFIDKFERIKRIPSKRQELLIFYSFVKSMIDSEYFFPPRDVKAEDGSVRDYDDILRLIEGVLKEGLSDKDIKLAAKIEYHITEHYKKTQRTKFNNMINEILDAMRHEYLIKFKYHNTDISVEPVKLIHYNGVWYLMAYVLRSTRTDNLKKVRIYNLALMQSNIFRSSEKFTEEEYDIPEFKDSFGIISSSNIKYATIRFYGGIVDRMQEMLWSKEQRTETGFDKEKGKYCQYIIPYPANTSFELTGKVLSFRENAEITGPPELRKEWKNSIQKMFEMIRK
ncbi:MAG: WYL domain-containing protein [Candidatus Delongbacteria bacterium]